MKTGPKPKSRSLKLLSAPARSRRGKVDHGGDPDTPIVPAGSIAAPAELSPLEKRHWDSLAGPLRDAGILTTLDTAMLRILVSQLAMIDLADEAIAKFGLVQKTKRATASTTPWIRIRNSASALALRISLEFGLTPSSRSRLKIEPPEAPIVRGPEIVDQEAEDAIDQQFFGKRTTPGA